MAACFEPFTDEDDNISYCVLDDGHEGDHEYSQPDPGLSGQGTPVTQQP